MKLDLRKRECREQEILDQIKEHKGVTTRWVLANRMRVTALDRLINSGRVQRLESSTRDFLRYRILDVERPSLLARVCGWFGGVRV